MKVMIQWATASAKDFEEIDSRDWADLPTKPNPIGDETIDDEKGWICRLNIQGMVFMADHIAVIHEDAFVKIIQWDDDPIDYTSDEFCAIEWRFFEVKDRGSGKPNTLQYATHYYSQAKIDELTASGQLPLYNSSSQEYVKIKEYSQFVKPEEKYTKHGIWLDDNLFQEIRNFHISNWTDWIDNNI